MKEKLTRQEFSRLMVGRCGKGSKSRVSRKGTQFRVCIYELGHDGNHSWADPPDVRKERAKRVQGCVMSDYTATAEPWEPAVPDVVFRDWDDVLDLELPDEQEDE